MSELDWPTLHAYNRLVSKGLTKNLACPDCKAPYVPTIDANDDLLFKCFFCGATLKPGLELAAQIRAVVKEHNA